MWPPCAPWGTKAPKGAWYQDEALEPFDMPALAGV